SGQLDIAGQVLVISGLYAVWCLLDAYGKEWYHRPARAAASALILGWTLGFLLAAPYLLPLLDYTRTGARMARRSSGAEERPPGSLSTLTQTVLPDVYGNSLIGSIRVLPGHTQNQAESSAAAYVGLVATLFVAPLAWCSRRHRSFNAFWVLLAFF